MKAMPAPPRGPQGRGPEGTQRLKSRLRFLRFARFSGLLLRRDEHSQSPNPPTPTLPQPSDTIPTTARVHIFVVIWFPTPDCYLYRLDVFFFAGCDIRGWRHALRHVQWMRPVPRKRLTGCQSQRIPLPSRTRPDDLPCHVTPTLVKSEDKKPLD